MVSIINMQKDRFHGAHYLMMGKQKYHKINVSPAILRYTAGPFHSWALADYCTLSV